MSSLARRPNGQWRARYRDAAGKEHARHFSRKVDAQRWLNEVTAAIVTGQYIDPQAGRTRVADYARGWEGRLVCRPATASIIDNALRLHVLPALGEQAMVNVRPADIQQMVRGLSDAGMAPGSVRNVYDVTAKLFRAAVRDRLIATSPCDGIGLPKPLKQDVHPPTTDQVVAIADAIDPRLRALVVTLAGTGLRIGEALGLVPSDVDFLRRSLRVERQRLQNGRLGPTKTVQSVRSVPLGEVVIQALAAHLAAGYGSEEALFTDVAGSPLTYRAWKRAWKSLPDSSGLTTHDLRHFYASALIAGGASVKQVQTVLGHSSAVITLRTYAHLWPGDDDRTRSISDTALGALRTGCGLDEQKGGVSAGQ